MKKQSTKDKTYKSSKKSAPKNKSKARQAGFLSISLKDFMSKNDKILVAIVTLGIFVLMVLSAFIIMNRGEDADSQNQGSASQQVSPTPSNSLVTPYPTVPTEVRNATIVVNRRSILPPSLTIKTGGRISFLNEDQIPINIQGYDNQSQMLNIGELPPSSSSAVVFEEPGVYEYVNSENPQDIAEIIVEE